MRVRGRAQVHGSEDSVDVDVAYVVPVMPVVRDCHAFCAADAKENRNLVVLRDGVVVDCFKVRNIRQTAPCHATAVGLAAPAGAPFVTSLLHRTTPAACRM